MSHMKWGGITLIYLYVVLEMVYTRSTWPSVVLEFLVSRSKFTASIYFDKLLSWWIVMNLFVANMWCGLSWNVVWTYTMPCSCIWLGFVTTMHGCSWLNLLKFVQRWCDCPFCDIQCMIPPKCFHQVVLHFSFSYLMPITAVHWSQCITVNARLSVLVNSGNSGHEELLYMVNGMLFV